MKNHIKQLLEESIATKQKIIDICLEDIELVGKVLLDAIKSDKTIFFCGNGGSAADSQHLAAEFVGRFQKERVALASIALTTDTSILTAVANDYGYDKIFSRQLEALGKDGDVLIGISSSGNSPNVVKAFEMAKTKGIKTVSLVGRDGGEMVKVSDYSIIVPSDVTARIQEAHICIGHILCEIAEEKY